MGKRGAVPKPTTYLRLTGYNRASMRPDEPIPDAMDTTPPEWLTGEGLECWTRVVAQLLAVGVLGTTDRNALARYCRLWEQWREADRYLKEKGTTFPVMDSNGKVRDVKPFPQVVIAMKLVHALGRLEQEFGLTPSARTRLAVDRVVQQTKKARFFQA